MPLPESVTGMYHFRFLQNWSGGVRKVPGLTRRSIVGTLKLGWSVVSIEGAERNVQVSTDKERESIVGRGSGLSTLHPFALGEEMSFDLG